MFRVQRSVKGLPSYSVNSVPAPTAGGGGVPGATAKLCGHFCQNIALFRQACFKNTFTHVFILLKYLWALVP